MRAALIVGINYYQSGSHLFGCVNDAYSVKSILERNDGGSVNFDCEIMTGTGPIDFVSRADLKDNIEELFKKDIEVVLFYFAGHGHIESSDQLIKVKRSSEDF